MNFIAKVKELDLPKDSFVVVGSSTMVVLGMAEEDNDVDLTVKQEIFDKFKVLGWKQEFFEDIPVLKHEIYDVGTRFYKWQVEDLLDDAIWVEDVPFMSLQKLLEWKKHMMREVDIPHIKLIEAYLRQHEN